MFNYNGPAIKYDCFSFPGSMAYDIIRTVTIAGSYKMQCGTLVCLDSTGYFIQDGDKVTGHHSRNTMINTLASWLEKCYPCQYPLVG